MAGQPLNRREIARRLQLPPKAVRAMLAEFASWFPDASKNVFTETDFARLERITNLRAQGLLRREIEDQLRQPVGEQALTAAAESEAAAENEAAAALEAELAPVAAQAEAERSVAPAAAELSRTEEAPQPERAQTAGVPPKPGPTARSAPLQPAGGAPESAQPPAVQAELVDLLRSLRASVEVSSARLVSDRERILTALMRTQQEVLQLRSEISTLRSRRDRKQGFIRRLMG